MCTLILSHRQHEQAPVLVAANRDERLGREARPPFEWPQGFFAPQDLRAHGTWLGVTRSGMFVGITNRFPAQNDASRRSRGLLTAAVLEQPNAAAAHRFCASLSATEFNPFHLLYADAQDAFVTYCDGVSVHQQTLAPGLHVVTERSLGGDDRSRTERVRQLYGQLGAGLPTVAELHSLLAQHDEGDPVAGTCIHLPQFDYGTRSSLVYFGGQSPRFFWSEGSPCTHPPAELGLPWATETSPG